MDRVTSNAQQSAQDLQGGHLVVDHEQVWPLAQGWQLEPLQQRASRERQTKQSASFGAIDGLEAAPEHLGVPSGQAQAQPAPF